MSALCTIYLFIFTCVCMGVWFSLCSAATHISASILFKYLFIYLHIQNVWPNWSNNVDGPRCCRQAKAITWHFCRTLKYTQIHPFLFLLLFLFAIFVLYCIISSCIMGLLGYYTRIHKLHNTNVYVYLFAYICETC